MPLEPAPPPPWRVAVIGGGRMGQNYCRLFASTPLAELAALVEPNAERATAVCAEFGIAAHHRDVPSMLAACRPQIVAVVTPGQFFRDAVLACAASPGMLAVQCEKPFGGPLADADAMVAACAEHGVFFAGGALTRALPELQSLARRLEAGEFGSITSVSMHGWSSEILGGGCQQLSVLMLLTNAEVVSVSAWSDHPLEGLRDVAGHMLDANDGSKAAPKPGVGPTDAQQDEPEHEDSVHFSAMLTLSSGLSCPTFGSGAPPASSHGAALPGARLAPRQGGVEVHTSGGYLIRWRWGVPEVLRLVATDGPIAELRPVEVALDSDDGLAGQGHHAGAVFSMLQALRSGDERDMYSTGAHVRHTLEVATAAARSALQGGAPVALPLEARDDTAAALFPRPYRWGKL
eukprot:COSAG04_NODE_2486_length_4027_cov_4.967413_2_plen_404_part_00